MNSVGLYTNHTPEGAFFNSLVIDIFKIEKIFPATELFGYNSLTELSEGVAEQIGDGYKNMGAFTDANQCAEFGYYYNINKANNMPSNLQEDYYLTLVVLKTLFGLIQFCIGNTKASLHVRARTSVGLWTDWKSLE